MQIPDFDTWSIDVHQRWLREFQASSAETLSQLDEQLRELYKVLDAFDPADDAALPLHIAICLPELGGELTRDERGRIQSPTFTIDGLRKAIIRGELKGSKRAEKYFTTRANIREWLWADREQEHGGSRRKGASAQTEKSGQRLGGLETTSMEKRLSSAKASARMLLMSSGKKTG